MKATESTTSKRLRLQSIDPSPIPERICACGCGLRFQPRSVRKIYFNKQHADYGYNRKGRKIKGGSTIEIEKQLRLNDRILYKYFSNGNGEFFEGFLVSLLAEGFSTEYYTGSSKPSNELFCRSYNFMYTITINNGHQLIRIYKA